MLGSVLRSAQVQGDREENLSETLGIEPGRGDDADEVEVEVQVQVPASILLCDVGRSSGGHRSIRYRESEGLKG